MRVSSATRVSEVLKNWQPRPRPERQALDGRYARLEPLDAERHGDALFEASTVSDADSRFRWLFEYPPTSRQEMLARRGRQYPANICAISALSRKTNLG
jgi:hypothetical protein